VTLERDGAPPRDELAERAAAILGLVESIDVAIFVTTPEGVVIEAHGSALGGAGLSPRLAIGKPLSSLVAHPERPLLRTLLQHAGPERADQAALRMNGRRSTFRARVAVLRQGDALLWAVRRERDETPTEAARGAEAQDRLASLFERLNQGIVAVDSSLRIVVANARASAVLGVRPLRRRSLLPDPWEDFGLPDFALEAFSADEPQEVTVSPDGVRLLSVTAIPPVPDGENVILVINDISERERGERLQQEFVANASHELRTPIATITGAIEILQSGAKEEPAARDRFLGHIEREVSRLGRLVQALLVLARAQAMQELPALTTVLLRPLLEEAAAGLSVASGVEVVVECPPRLAALADGGLLLEVVLNLVGNAAKHTREGRIVLQGREGRDDATIEVQDTGPGIPPEEHEALFARFYRGVNRDAMGFGLGLAIVREAVAVLGGGIEVQSAPGTGTTVRVILPIAREGIP
jgi:signal transduction histidine kinase